MEPQSPFNIWPLDIDKFIDEHEIGEVTSFLSWEPSSTKFHPDGLYSETIFGQVGSTERLGRLGYMTLGSKIFVPIAYKNLIDIKGFYQTVMEGKAYAKFDNKLKDLVPAEPTTPGAETGYSFVVRIFPQLKFVRNKSRSRTNKIEVLEQLREKNVAFTTKLLILPAGIRDMRKDGDMYTSDEINQIYLSLLSLSQEVKDSEDPVMNKLYDGVRYLLQKKLFELYLYHKNFLDGKTGFVQRRYARRAIAWGSRNVISVSTSEAASPESASYHKHNETIIPLFQAAKAFQPLVIHTLRELFYSQIFGSGETTITAIDPKTYKTQYIEVTDREVTKGISSLGLESIIQMFQNAHIRTKPVIVRDKNNKFYYPFLVYDLGDRIYVLKNVDDFVSFMESNVKNIEFSETETLKFQNEVKITTTVVGEDFHKYHEDDQVKTPWGEVYKVNSRQELLRLKSHPKYDELTEEQKEYFGKHSDIAVLELVLLTADQIRSEKVDRSKIRPLSYLEMMYFAVYRATQDKYSQVTRYPAIELGSTYVAKTKIGTTAPSREVRFCSQFNETQEYILPHYPILGKDYVDSLIIHDSQTRGLGADYDGDTVSLNGIMSDEATRECQEYLSSIRSIIGTDGKFFKSASTDLTDITLFNLTRIP